MQQALGYAEHARRAVRLQLERRRLPLPRPHGPEPAIETRVWRSTSSRRRRSSGAATARGRGSTPTPKRIVTQDYHADGSGKEPRYYQRQAINRDVEAVAKGQNRVLLVMATGTGKTYTAFQIIWRLWKAGAKKRILFLADRNILVDQTRDERLQAVRRGDDEDHATAQVDKSLRDLPLRSTRPSRATRSAQHLQGVLAATSST